MTLLLTVFAAVFVSVKWYQREDDSLNLTPLMFMYWGASLMWLADAIFEYSELGAEYFSPSSADLINDGFLGLSVIALGLVIWIVILFVKDPKGSVTKAIVSKTK
ncbi:MAG: hypothetical protein IIT46_11685 [Lachnospiraceae bacterium]|nr:hypothetical protein [Lachnospiraceae bacterium]MCR4802928.1 hypothetical protein [Lachnospiraceae bacterium]